MSTEPWVRTGLRRLDPTFVLVGVAPVLVLAAWLSLAPARPLVRLPALLVLLLVHYVPLVDAVDLVVRSLALRRQTLGPLLGRRAPTSLPLEVGHFSPSEVSLLLRPYALVVSVHDAELELQDFLEGLGPLRERLWVIDDASTDSTWYLLQRAGVHAVRSEVNRHKPAAIRQLLRQLPPEIETVVVLDPDVRFLGRDGEPARNLERVVFEFQRSGQAALSPRLTVRRDGWLARFQGLEYELACRIGRRSLADASVTPGVALYRREALERVLAQHSLSVYAEDLENAFLLLGEGERIYYDDRLAAETEGKRALLPWFSQRVGWAYGLARVYLSERKRIGRITRGRRFVFYQFVVYLGVLTLLLHPVRLAALLLLLLSMLNGIDGLLGFDLMRDGLLNDPRYFLTVYAQYTLLTLVAACLASGSLEGVRRHGAVVPFYFFYVLLQVVPVTVGYLNWIGLRLFRRRFYRDHYEPDDRRVERNGGPPS